MDAAIYGYAKAKWDKGVNLDGVGTMGRVTLGRRQRRLIRGSVLDKQYPDIVTFTLATASWTTVTWAMPVLPDNILDPHTIIPSPTTCQYSLSSLSTTLHLQNHPPPIHTQIPLPSLLPKSIFLSHAQHAVARIITIMITSRSCVHWPIKPLEAHPQPTPTHITTPIYHPRIGRN